MGSNEVSNIRSGQVPFVKVEPGTACRTIFSNLLREVQQIGVAHNGLRPDTSIIQAMTEAQKTRYLQAILQVMLSRDSKVVTPSLCFEAADMAVADEVSASEAHVGLQPGTMNPIHYGHISASLAGILVNKLDLVLLAAGGTVPDKPYSVDSTIRNQMLRIATREHGLAEWLHVTPIRQQTVEMFSVNKQTLLLAGESEFVRRSNMDIAAFIWLFRANPKVTWTYLVGSDKVAGYGRLDEYDLIVRTLADSRVNARVLYSVRDDNDVDVSNHIAPYGWMLEKWQRGFFKRSPLPTCAVSARKIKTALVAGHDHVDGLPLDECLPEVVITYIRTHETLLTSYAREVRELESA